MVSRGARRAERRAVFSNAEQFNDAAQMAASGERHQVLKEEVQSLWEEWERLSLEAEGIANRIQELKAD